MKCFSYSNVSYRTAIISTIVLLCTVLIQFILKVKKLNNSESRNERFVSYAIILMYYSYYVGLCFSSLIILKTFKVIYIFYLTYLFLFLLCYGTCIFFSDHHFNTIRKTNLFKDDENFPRKANFLLYIIFAFQIIYFIISINYYVIINIYVEEYEKNKLKEEEEERNEMMRELDNSTLVNEQAIDHQEYYEDNTVVNSDINNERNNRIHSYDIYLVNELNDSEANNLYRV